MLKKILVPLDGSKLAECALPYMEEIARGCKTKDVVLVSITERVSGQTSASEIQAAYGSTDRTDLRGVGSDVTVTSASEIQGASAGRMNLSGAGSDVAVTLGKKERQAQRYLGKLEKALTAKGINVQAEVLIGNPAEEIAKFAENNGVDLIIMSSHGRSGPSRWAFGSVADKVFRASCVPVLMIKAPNCIPGI